MARDFMGLGSAPFEEDCVSVTLEGDYQSAMEAECKRYIAKLIAVHGEPPTFTRFRIKWYPHDFGSYAEVEVVFDDMDEESVAYAYKVEANLPAKWA